MHLLNLSMNNDKKLAFKIAAFNSIGFIIAVSIPTYLDPLLTSDVVYGPRHYTMGYWVNLFAILVFFPTYVSIIKAKVNWQKYIFSCLFLILCGTFVLWNFKPEFPHGNVVLCVIGYSVVSVVTVWIRYTPLHMEYVENNEIAVQARIEGIKSTLNIWKTITYALIANYLTILYYWLKSFQEFNGYVVTKQEEMVLLNISSEIKAGIFLLYVVIGPLKESLYKIWGISREFFKIKEAI
jgi:hypothetical protein